MIKPAMPPEDAAIVAQMPRRSMFSRLVARIMPPRRPEDRVCPTLLLQNQSNAFYGWYDDPDQASNQPTVDPPHDGPCLFCGGRIHAADVRTHTLMWSGPVYAKRCYFYRTHASCADMGHGKGLAMDGLIFDMIERNGD